MLLAQIEEFIKGVFSAIECPIDSSKINIIDRGLPHIAPRSLPKGKMAIYTFVYEDRFLKI